MVQKTSKPRHKKLWIIAGIVVIILGTLVTLKALGVFKSDDQKAQEQTQAYNNSKKEAVVDNNGTPSSSGTKGSTPTPYTPPSTDDGITITPSTSGSNVVIITKLVGYSDGTCTLTISNDSKTNTQSAEVIYAPNYSTCAGFSIPKSTLGAGNWNITLSILSGGNTTSKTTMYEVSP